MDGSSARSPGQIPPLIPVPVQKGDEKEDVFASLFSPPTPRASPSRTPEPTYSRPARHARQESTDSEFGAFVSVPATEDPLRLGGGPGPPSFTPLHKSEFFDKFAEDAKAASQQRRSQVLDELLQHEDDPLYWLQGTSTVNASGSSTPQSSQNASRTDLQSNEDSLIDLNSPSDAQRSFDALASHTGPVSVTSPVPAPAPSRSVPIDLDPLNDAREGDHGARQRAQASPHHLVSLSPVRSQTLAPSTPTRPSDPEIQHAQSSYFTPPSIPTRWVSSLLTSTIRGTRTSPSTPPPETSIASLFGPSSEDHSWSRSAPHSRAPTHSESAPPATIPITHGSPFASQPFVPPSGAPGFAGDRQWDKGFEFDKTQVEKQSVRLVGRREMTTPVLTVEIADMLRPFFPALVRLPKQWSLLYSLDQHGISLNTLYTRCQDFKGSALVVVRDSGDRVFGAWMGEGIHPSKGAYYGSGESFLWQSVGKDRVRVFKWTGKNDYVALCEPDYISFGGGDGRSGLWLDDTLIDGSSARCLTFDNEPLCSAGPRRGEAVTFECVGLEVWGIG
ncbi:TLD-domain-containing protein [Dichomitus squalens]|uniref:Oxidation resistance protein 1 n=2 Tax=Dichomitus squalens TaxID=114155 RepID=A0A4Q9PIN0_9APHY|nr:TLD-domain-containing protein [Dichomitus squalens]TBU53914.1 TLD-domain-containing protein [Dichomitus squalens]